MKRLNQSGFTLIEVLAVIAIIAILGLVSVPAVLNSIENSKEASYNILLENIETAGISLYEEVDLGNTLYHYNIEGKEDKKIELQSESTIEITLQTLVSNGFLKGTTKENVGTQNSNNQNDILLLNPITGEDIGECKISIKKIVDSTTYKTTYKFMNITDTEMTTSCPTL